MNYRDVKNFYNIAVQIFLGDNFFLLSTSLIISEIRIILKKVQKKTVFSRYFFQFSG